MATLSFMGVECKATQHLFYEWLCFLFFTSLLDGSQMSQLACEDSLFYKFVQR